MALIDCSECGRTVSTDAKTCPGCGASKRKFKRSSLSGQDILIIGCIFLVVVVASNMLPGGNGESSSQTDTAVTSQTSEQSQKPRTDYSMETPLGLFRISGRQGIAASLACIASMANGSGLPVTAMEVTNKGFPPVIEYESSDGQQSVNCKFDGNEVLVKASDSPSYDRISNKVRFEYWRNDEEILSKVTVLETGEEQFKRYNLNSLVAIRDGAARDTKIAGDPTSIAGDDAICKAAVAMMFGQSPNIIRIQNSGSPFVLSYVRPKDGSSFKYRCKIRGNEIIWAGFIDGKWGRWRNGQYDPEVTYKVSKSKIVISEQYPGDKANTESYDLSAL